MQIFVNGLDGTLLTLNVEPLTLVGDIKRELEAEDTILSYGASILDNDESTLESLDIHGDATININARLLGGKVHGSLARAGKVRAQTPKVEKQEKKRKKRGRAFRRMQYNRRYVNVAVQGPGRKRGPNARPT